MYKPKTVRAFSVLAIILSLLGLVFSGVMMTQANGLFLLTALSWAILLWASFIGFRLSGYQLSDDDFKKVGLRIYLILAAFVLSMSIGVVVGLLFSGALLASLWGMKKNYDEWNNKPVS